MRIFATHVAGTINVTSDAQAKLEKIAIANSCTTCCASVLVRATRGDASGVPLGFIGLFANMANPRIKSDDRRWADRTRI